MIDIEKLQAKIKLSSRDVKTLTEAFTELAEEINRIDQTKANAQHEHPKLTEEVEKKATLEEVAEWHKKEHSSTVPSL